MSLTRKLNGFHYRTRNSRHAVLQYSQAKKDLTVWYWYVLSVMPLLRRDGIDAN
jgi:hypothetical protein